MSVTVEKIDVLSFVITGAERLDPVRVMIENYEPGKGRITITCYRGLTHDYYNQRATADNQAVARNIRTW